MTTTTRQRVIFKYPIVGPDTTLGTGANPIVALRLAPTGMPFGELGAFVATFMIPPGLVWHVYAEVSVTT